MSRDHRLFLDDMVASCEKALSYTQGLTLDQFLADEIVGDAVLMNLLVIGEAANRLPEGLRGQHPEVPWGTLIGLRNIIAHGYFALDRRIIWETSRNDLPTLLPQLRQIVIGES